MPPKKKIAPPKKDVVDEYHVEKQEVNFDHKKRYILQVRRVDIPAETQPSTQEAEPPKAPMMKLLQPSHNTVCYWCCHQFHGEPIGLPIKHKNNQFHVCGNFCSFECATSFNFNSTELGQNTWESFHLLNNMARHMGVKTPIAQTASRFSLKMFGGWMDIDEFRQNNVKYTPLPFPMVPIVQVMDEVNNSTVGNKPAFVPLENHRIQKAKQNIFNAYKKDTIHDKMKMGHVSDEA